jgi:ABC-type multidrug transport system ATPase subunit
MVATVMKPSEGEIHFGDIDILEDPNAIRQRLGYLPQDFGTYDQLSAREFLAYFAALKGVSSASKVDEMLESVNLHTVADRQVGGFSGGMKQRLGIAQALINDPDLLIVDEPTAGLDPEERVRFRNLLTDFGRTKLVILSTHIVSDIESTATRIAILREGSLVAFETPEALLRLADGWVWEATVPSSRLDELRKKFPISRSQGRPDGAHLRLVAPEAPLPGASQAVPTPEDAYLRCMNFDLGTGDRI